MSKYEPELQEQTEIGLERGSRLAQLRRLTGYNRLQFERIFGFSRGSIEHMEKLSGNHSGIRQHTADRIVNAVIHEGFVVTAEWILHGTGQPPYRLKPQAKPKLNFLRAEKNDEEIKTIVKNTLIALGEDFLPLQVHDDAMEPTYIKGDWIIGKPVKKELWGELKGQRCIATLSDKTVVARIFDSYGIRKTVLLGENSDSVDKHKHLYQPEISRLYQIIWHLKWGQA